MAIRFQIPADKFATFKIWLIGPYDKKVLQDGAFDRSCAAVSRPGDSRELAIAWFPPAADEILYGQNIPWHNPHACSWILGIGAPRCSALRCVCFPSECLSCPVLSRRGPCLQAPRAVVAVVQLWRAPAQDPQEPLTWLDPSPWPT